MRTTNAIQIYNNKPVDKLQSTDVIVIDRPAAGGVPADTKGAIIQQIIDLANKELEQNIQISITAEATARQASDQILQGNINAEALERQNADNTLQGNITVEAAARETADTTEATERQSADNTLQGNITAEAAARETADTTEATERQSADNTLQANITAEAAARETADTTEAPERQCADTRLNSYIEDDAAARETADTTDATERQSADNTLQANITTEAAARETADNTLSLALEDEAAARETADTTEATERQSADNTLQANIAAEATARQTADIHLKSMIESKSGIGGAITAHDFGENPTQEDITKYACESIWGAGGTWTWNEHEPRESTYIINYVTNKAGDIFNNTWVRNTYNNSNHKWVLTNTPNTVPPVFVWIDVGQDVVAQATDTYAGVAKLYNDLTNENIDGSVTQAALVVFFKSLLLKSGGAMTGTLADPTVAQLRNIRYGTDDLVAGMSELATGELYFVYE
jgi:chemotaxis protein histidine kinase CheA